MACPARGSCKTWTQTWDPTIDTNVSVGEQKILIYIFCRLKRRGAPRSFEPGNSRPSDWQTTSSLMAPSSGGCCGYLYHVQRQLRLMQQNLWEPVQLGWRGHSHRHRRMPDGGIKTSRAEAPDVHCNLHTLQVLVERVYQDFCKRQASIANIARMMCQWGVPLTMLWIDTADFGFMQPATIGAFTNGDLGTTAAADDDADVRPDLADKLIQDYPQVDRSRNDFDTYAEILDYSETETVGPDITVDVMILDHMSADSCEDHLHEDTHSLDLSHDCKHTYNEGCDFLGAPLSTHSPSTVYDCEVGCDFLGGPLTFRGPPSPPDVAGTAQVPQQTACSQLQQKQVPCSNRQQPHTAHNDLDMGWQCLPFSTIAPCVCGFLGCREAVVRDPLSIIVSSMPHAWGRQPTQDRLKETH